MYVHDKIKDILIRVIQLLADVSACDGQREALISADFAWTWNWETGRECS